MGYAMTQILRRIWKNGKLYGLVALQLCFVFALLTAAVQVSVSLEHRVRALEAVTDTSLLRADIQDTSVRSGAFDYDVYATIEKTPDCPTGLLTRAMLGATMDGMPESITVLCVPVRYFTSLLDEPWEEGVVYCDKELYDCILAQKLTIFGDGVDIVFGEGDCRIDEHTFRLSPLSNPNGITEIRRDENEENNIPLNRVLLLPEETGVYFQNSVFVSYEMYFYPASRDQYGEAYAKLYRCLQDVAISIYDPAAFLMQWNQEIADTMKIVSLVGALLLAVTVLGTTGIFLILLYKRRKDMAVCVAIGCSPSLYRWELFGEVLLVCLVGIGGGMLLSLPVLHWLTPERLLFSVVFTGEAVLLAIVSMVVIAGLVTVLSLVCMRKYSVVALLREE